MTKHTPGDELSEEDRRQAFRAELGLLTENGAGRVVGRIPKKLLWGSISVLIILGVGGQFVEHYFGNIGVPSPSKPSTTLTTPSGPRGNTTTTAPSAAVAAAAYIDLKPIATATAPSFTLTDQNGRPYGTTQARGRVTLITFFNKNCNDICPVVGAELKSLIVDLGARASGINVIIVNTDPFSYGASAQPLALTRTRLSHFPNVHFVTGPLARLNSVWANYGVKIQVGTTASEVTHNSIIYFISATSGLAATARPFAGVDKSGVFSLAPGDIARFAEGLRIETGSLNE